MYGGGGDLIRRNGTNYLFLKNDNTVRGLTTAQRAEFNVYYATPLIKDANEPYYYHTGEKKGYSMKELADNKYIEYVPPENTQPEKFKILEEPWDSDKIPEVFKVFLRERANLTETKASVAPADPAKQAEAAKQAEDAKKTAEDAKMKAEFAIEKTKESIKESMAIAAAAKVNAAAAAAETTKSLQECAEIINKKNQEAFKTGLADKKFIELNVTFAKDKDDGLWKVKINNPEQLQMGGRSKRVLGKHKRRSRKKKRKSNKP